MALCSLVCCSMDRGPTLHPVASSENMHSDWPIGVILVELFEDQCHARLLQNTRWWVVGAILQFWGYWIDGEFAPAKARYPWY